MARYPKDEREVAESPKIQGIAESRAYTFDFGADDIVTIASVSAAVYLDGVDVTASVMPSGAATASGLVVTTPKLTGLLAGAIYHMYARVVHDGGQQSELFCRVLARD